eukprot:m.94855 g.94855  ORF g.94855 m.94855 type:complete len:68 (+) comp20404_c0_seq1:241-444(+)
MSAPPHNHTAATAQKEGPDSGSTSNGLPGDTAPSARKVATAATPVPTSGIDLAASVSASDTKVDAAA